VDEGASLEGQTIEVCVCVWGYEALIQAKSLDDLGDAKPNFLNQIEEKFEKPIRSLC